MKEQSKTIKVASPQSSDQLADSLKPNILACNEGSGNTIPGRNRLSPERTSDADEVVAFSFPKVVVAYDDVPAGLHAIRVLTNIFHEPEDRQQLSPGFWRFDFLEDTHWFALALADATDADIIVIATSSIQGLKTSVEDWIKSFLPQKRGSSAAIVALLGPEGGLDGPDSPRFQFLQSAVQMAGLVFFAPQSRHDNRFWGDGQIARNLNQKRTQQRP